MMPGTRGVITGKGLRLWGIKELGDRTIDLAREFGAAQCIFNPERVVALFDRDKTQIDVFSKERENVKTYSHL